ncbi:hypothetical protein KKB40_04235, partial [Patescibacteria group bacterium]|nr:hypothetical protein [Patescibacteria group bacterium]
FYAEQLSNNPNASPPDLENGRTWSSELKKCVSDLIGQHLLTFTCTSGCSGDYPHTMNVILMDTATGVFSGDGFYNPNAGYTWDVSGNTAGSTISFHILYTGIGAGYTVDAIGTMNLNGTSFGSATSSSGQVFTWIMD